MTNDGAMRALINDRLPIFYVKGWVYFYCLTKKTGIYFYFKKCKKVVFVI
jgi:hypothetical protein